jgi:hypothetical protein
MDLIQLAAVIIIMGLAYYVLERLPFPSNPPWLKRAAEGLLALVFLLWLADRVLGLNLVHA